MAEVLTPPISTPNGIDERNEQTDVPASPKTTQFRERDEVFWTELEIRRLGNLVAECIHARRYVGNTKDADLERKQMRKYIDAMKRKSMRVLHRAELYAKSGHAAWPGIDPTITDPVSLAEEYVRVVENYETVLNEEQCNVKAAKEGERVKFGDLDSSTGADGIEAIPTEPDDWEAQDDKAYKEALEREKERAQSSGEARKELLGNNEEGIRQRRSGAGPSNQGAKFSKEDEEFMSRQQSVQDELTSNLVDLVGELKKSISENKVKLDRDSKVMDETEDAVDRNLDGVGRQRTELKKFSQSTSVSWWVMMIAAVFIIVVFILVFVLLKIPL